MTFVCTVRRQESPDGRVYARYTTRTPSTSSMPTQRKTIRCKLMPVERAYIVGRHDAGEGLGKISKKTGIPKSTVGDTIYNNQKHDTIKSLPRTGPCKTDTRTDRKLCCEMRKDAKNH
jgi:hypothetical protein